MLQNAVGRVRTASHIYSDTLCAQPVEVPRRRKDPDSLGGIRAKISVVELCRRSPSGREAAQAATRPGPQGRPPSEGYRSEGISLLANTCRRAASLARPPTS